MRLWVSQIDVIAQEQQSESGGGVTGTQHAPVESQIETVASVSAQLAPGRHTELSWHQADTQTAMQQTERPLRESLLISSERAASILLHLFATRLSPARVARYSASATAHSAGTAPAASTAP